MLDIVDAIYQMVVRGAGGAQGEQLGVPAGLEIGSVEVLKHPQFLLWPLLVGGCGHPGHHGQGRVWIWLLRVILVPTPSPCTLSRCGGTILAWGHPPGGVRDQVLSCCCRETQWSFPRRRTRQRRGWIGFLP